MLVASVGLVGEISPHVIHLSRSTADIGQRSTSAVGVERRFTAPHREDVLVGRRRASVRLERHARAIGRRIVGVFAIERDLDDLIVSVVHIHVEHADLRCDLSLAVRALLLALRDGVVGIVRLDTRWRIGPALGPVVQERAEDVVDLGTFLIGLEADVHLRLGTSRGIRVGAGILVAGILVVARTRRGGPTLILPVDAGIVDDVSVVADARRHGKSLDSFIRGLLYGGVGIVAPVIQVPVEVHGADARRGCPAVGFFPLQDRVLRIVATNELGLRRFVKRAPFIASIAPAAPTTSVPNTRRHDRRISEILASFCHWFLPVAGLLS